MNRLSGFRRHFLNVTAHLRASSFSYPILIPLTLAHGDTLHLHPHMPLITWSICALLTQLNIEMLRNGKITKLEQFLKIDYIFNLKKKVCGNIAVNLGYLKGQGSRG